MDKFTMTTTYSKDQKDQALDVLRKQLESGERAAFGDVQEISRKLNIPTQTLYTWKANLKKSLNGSCIKADKLQVIMETSSMNELELGEYLRRNGILKEELESWSETAKNSLSENKVQSSELAALKKENKELQKELRRKEKALAETAALLVLSKKAQAIWGEPGDD